MARRNYFEILKLAFDPVESRDKKIQQAIEKWKKETSDNLANESNDFRKSQLREELALEKDMEATLKDKNRRKEEANALKEQRIEQLEKLIDILLSGQSGTPEVNRAQIDRVKEKLGLSDTTIQSVYEKKGFTVKKPEASKVKDAFLTKTVADNISREIVQFRQLSAKTPGDKYKWAENVSDLFDLAFYCSEGNKSDAAGFRKKKTTDLHSIMEAISVDYSRALAGPEKSLATLGSAGKSQVFNTEVNRKRYEQTLEREKLKEFFALLKSAPEVFKKDPYFADNCIKRIQEHFPDFKLALDLYNDEAGLKNDPYEPIEAFIHVTCASCGTSLKFRTREEAEKVGCTVCDAKLYVACPECHKNAPAAADWCACGFRISEMRFFDEYFKAAQAALKEMDLTEAQKQLDNAKNAHPGHSGLSELEKQIQTASDKYQQPLKELNALIEAGNFCAAQKRLDALAVSMPKLKLDGQRRLISNKIAEARGMMPGPNLPESEKVNRCVAILENVKDYQPAIEMIRQYKPGAPVNLHGVTSSKGPLTYTLTWNSAKDRGVSYSVVRKKNGIPQSCFDGDMLVRDLNGLEYKDTSIEPGIRYGYAVFAHRAGACSAPATCEFVKYSELDKSHFHAEADYGACRFSWVLPKNCNGVRILRCTNAIPSEYPSANCTIVAEQAFADYEDKNLSNNTTYGYRLQCMYRYGDGFRYSEGITEMLTPEQPPAALKDVTVKTEGNTVYVRWTSDNTTKGSVFVQQVTSSSVNSKVGQVLSATQINSILGNGKKYATTPASARECQFKIPPYTTMRLAVVINSGTKCVISEVVQVSNIEKSEISEAGTRILDYNSSRLQIKLKNKPEYIQRYHYLVAKKEGAEGTWATVEDAKRNKLPVITVKKYQDDGMILIENAPKGILCISVIGEYKMPDGSVVYSDASRHTLNNTPKKEIKCHLKWSREGIFNPSWRCKLIVTTDLRYIPTLKLAYRSDKRVPYKITDPQTVELHTIPFSTNGFTGGKYEHEFPGSTWNNIKPGSELRILKNDKGYFTDNVRIGYQNLDSWKVPQK